MKGRVPLIKGLGFTGFFHFSVFLIRLVVAWRSLEVAWPFSVLVRKGKTVDNFLYLY